MYDKLHLGDERSEDGDARSMLMERQASVIGDAVDIEPILINRKDAALEQRKVRSKLLLLNIFREHYKEKFPLFFVAF
uniref:Uncharacterized protein n=1 Tax=Arundo donax TaxID=35708 RepID=A0A0A9FDZ4_ARUDO